MQHYRRKILTFFFAAVFAMGTVTSAFADSITVNSSSELATGVGDIFSTAVVNKQQVTVWEIDKNDSLILSELDLPYQTYRTLSVGILYPQPDGSYKIGLESDESFDYASGAGSYVMIDTDLNAGEEYYVFDAIRFHGDLGGHTTDECLYFLMFSYDREDGPAAWTGDVFLKFVRSETLAHLRESARNSGTESRELPAPAAKPEWKSNAIGWWVEYSDGSYLVNTWYQSPASGLWYYMGADGYMLTDAQTPDGYWVNSDGVWVQ